MEKVGEEGIQYITCPESEMNDEKQVSISVIKAGECEYNLVPYYPRIVTFGKAGAQADSNHS